MVELLRIFSVRSFKYEKAGPNPSTARTRYLAWCFATKRMPLIDPDPENLTNQKQEIRHDFSSDGKRIMS